MQEFIFNRYSPGQATRAILIGLLVCSIGWFTSCQKEDNISRNYPRLKTLAVTDITGSGAVFNAEVVIGNTDEILEYGFVWNDVSYPEIQWHDKQFSTNPLDRPRFSETIRTNLHKEVTYHVRAYLRTDNYLVYGNVITFISMGSDNP